MTDSLEELTKQVIAQIEGQNWTDEPLSDQEKHLIGMAVSATMAASDIVPGFSTPQQTEWVINIRFKATEVAADALMDQIANDIFDKMPTAVVGMTDGSRS